MRMITGVAIKFLQWDKYHRHPCEVVVSLKKPHRHSDLLLKLNWAEVNDHKQGFVDQDGVFLDRTEAFLLAQSNEQLIRDIDDPDKYQGAELYSEDLW
jgi:hypothetical protein